MSVTSVNRAASSQGALSVLTQYVAKTRDSAMSVDGPAKGHEAQVAAVGNVSAVKPAVAALRSDQMVPGVADRLKLRTTASPAEATSADSASTAKADADNGEGGTLDVKL
jgi:hypothetical protein